MEVNQLPHHSCFLQKIAELLLHRSVCVDVWMWVHVLCICVRARGAWARMWHTLEARLRDVHISHVT